MRIRMTAKVKGFPRLFANIPDHLTVDCPDSATFEIFDNGQMATLTTNITEPLAIGEELAALADADILKTETAQTWFKEQYISGKRRLKDLLSVFCGIAATLTPA